MVTTAYAWADRLLEGTLDERLRQYRAEGMSAERIAFELRAQQVEVSRETVRRWINEMPLHEAAS